MERELNFLRRALTPADIGKERFTSGDIAGKTIYLLRTGIGPAKTLQRLAELEQKCEPECIISMGCAGALDSSLLIGDAIISEAFHDDSGDDVWKPAPALVDAAINCCRKLAVPFRVGSTVSTSAVAATPSEKKRLAKKYGALAVDMESVQVAGWAAKSNIPMLSIRTISDLADDELPREFSGLFDRDGNFRILEATRRLAAKPSLLLAAHRFRTKFERSLAVLARIMLPFLESL
jgi:adenosylhomocysteine nucleosidase